MISFQFQKASKSAGCEDAPPVSTARYSIVCDGLGGSGSMRHSVLEDDAPVTRTSAYIGARIVSACVRQYYDRHMDKLFAAGADQLAERMKPFVQELRSEIAQTLNQEAVRLKIEPARSRMFRIFPTTMASTLYFSKGRKLYVAAIWAGDSRVYILSPSRGLLLLSLDDAENASGRMNSSSTMNNCIAARNSFYLNYALYELNEPGIVFCCTDGCFDYMQSPLHFEWLLLNTILECMPNCGKETLGETFAASVRDCMYPSIGDDTTMAGVCFRMNARETMRRLYRPRMNAAGEQAVQMNEYLKELRQIQNRRDAARKTCRLHEDRTGESIHAAVCEALTSHASSPLYAFLARLPFFPAFAQRYEQIDASANQRRKELHDSHDKVRLMKEMCTHMLIRDHMTSQNLLNAPEAYPSDISLDFCMITSGYFLNWIYAQIYTLTFPFHEEHKRIEKDPDFQKTLDDVLENSGRCDCMSDPTRRKIEEYQRIRQDYEAKNKHFQAEHLERLNRLATEFYTSHREEILSLLFRQSPDTLRILFTPYPFVPLDQLLAVREARETLEEAKDVLNSVQDKIGTLWEAYRATYELFRNVTRNVAEDPDKAIDVKKTSS